MFRRSLVLAALFTTVALPALDAQAGFWNREEPKAAEHEHVSHDAVSKAKRGPANAYAKAMHQMHRDMGQPLSGNVDVDFARQMIPHHQGALAMARIQQARGKDEELKRFNDWVIQAQTQEIAMMENWLRRRDGGAAPKNAENYFGEAMKKMHHGMMIRATGDADVDYVRGMIAHHQGAVDMAEVLLAHGTDPELNALANDIYSSQNYEIAWMKDWLKARRLDCGKK